MVFRIFKKKEKRQKSPLLEKGFHCDEYLLAFVDSLMHKCEVFIETGTNVGSTLSYVARKYPHLRCLSCEPDKEAFEEAKKNTGGLGNVELVNLLSQDFIAVLAQKGKELFAKEALFWLDAHGYGFKWPLKEELSFITGNFASGYILIDDFLVPGMDCFKYDVYQEQICSFEFVKDALNKKHEYRIYYPDYTERTSPHHPLAGWGLIEFGHESSLALPAELAKKIKGPVS